MTATAKKILVSLLGCALATTSCAADKVIFAIDLIRHGDRTPAFNMPKSDYQWPQGLGELTPTGMAQELALGQQRRKVYV